jgi:hypothetical protein
MEVVKEREISNQDSSFIQPTSLLAFINILEIIIRLITILYWNVVPPSVSAYFLEMGVVLNSKLLRIWANRTIRICSLTFFTTSNFASFTIFLELKTSAYLLLRHILNETLSKLNVELGLRDSFFFFGATGPIWALAYLHETLCFTSVF